jgi:hypothetical protein
MSTKKTFKHAIQQEILDEETGELTRQYLVTEVVPDYIDVKLPKKHKFNNGPFITLFQNTMLDIAKHGNLTKNELLLLLYLIGTAGMDNMVSLDLDILSSELKLAKSNVSTALSGLVKRNIVFRKDGYRYGHAALPFQLKLNYDQINYNMTYKNKIKGFASSVHKHPSIELNNETAPNQIDMFKNEIAEPHFPRESESNT